MKRVKREGKRAVIGIVGGFIVAIGIVAIPYPGPGWLIVFSGLAVLSIEFDWAKRILARAREKYDAWGRWLSRQNYAVRGGVLLFTCTVVVSTLWLLNTYGFINNILGLEWNWTVSPLPWF